MNEPQADKTQILGPDALRAAQVEGAEPAQGGQATVMLPAGLPMLEPPPPLGEETTQPLPLVQVDPEVEVRTILEGPDATVRLQAGLPAPPAEDPSTTRLLPVGDPALPIATQVMPIGAPALPDPLDHPVDARTIEIPPHHLPATERKGMPIWGWVGLGAAALLLAGGTLWLLRPALLGGSAETEASEPAPSEMAPAGDTAPTTPPEATTAEVPPALRPYLEKAEKGDAAAMRMLAVMYYQGLNVPRNEREGLKWYRRSAEAGSSAAAKELKAIEGKSPEK